MKKKIFSGGVFAEGMRKLRVFGFISAAVMLLIEFAPVLIAYAERRSYGAKSTPAVIGFWGICPAVPICAFVIAPLMMFILFSGFNKRSFCDFYHALPYTRQCIFVSYIASVLTWVLSISAASIAVGIVSRLALPWAFALSFYGFGTKCLMLFIVALLMCGAVALASSVTGTLLSNVTVTGLILFFPRYIAYVVSSLVIDFVPVMTNIQSIPLLSPRYNLLIGMLLGGSGFNTMSDTDTCISIIYTFVVAVFYLLLAAFLFVRRKSETAGQSAPGRKTQAVIRIALTLVPSVLGTAMIMSDEAAVGVILWIIAIIVYFAYEILSTMRWSNLLRAVPYLLAVVVLNVVIVVAVNGMSYAGMNYMPAADDVESIRLMGSGRNVEYIANRISQYEIKDKELIEIVTDALADNINTYKKQENGYLLRGDRTVSKEIAIKEGFVTRYRNIYFDIDDYGRIIQLLKNDVELKKSIMTLPEAVANSMTVTGVDNITASEGEELLSILQKEINAGGFESWMSSVDDVPYIEDSETYSDVMNETYVPIVSGDTFYVEYTVESSNRMSMFIRVSKDLYPEAYNYILDMSWEKAKSSDNFDKVLDALKMIADRKVKDSDTDINYLNVHSSIYADGICYDADLDAGFTVGSDGEIYLNISLNGDDTDDDAAISGAKVLYELLTCMDEDVSPDADRYNSVEVRLFNDDGYDGICMSFYAPVPKDFDFDGEEAFVKDTEQSER